MAANPESLDWLDQLNDLKTHLQTNPKAKRPELQKVVDGSNSLVTTLLALKTCLDPEAIQRIRSAAEGADSHKESTHPKLGPQLEASAQGLQPYILSFNRARALARLKGKVTNLTGTVHTALDSILSERLTTKKIMDLVDRIIKGYPPSIHPKNPPKSPKVKTKPPNGPQVPESSNPDAQDTPVPRPPAERLALGVPIINKGVKEIGTMPTSNNSGDEGRYVPIPKSGIGAPVPSADSLQKLIELAKKAGAEEALGGSNAAREQLTEYLKKMSGDKTSTAPEPPKEEAKPQKLSELGKLLWLAFLGVSIYKQVKAKINKGERPSVGILLLLIITQLVGWGWSFFWRFPRFCWKHFWRALEKLGQIFPDLKRLVQFLSSVAIVALVVWGGWKIYNHSFHPIAYLKSKIHLSFSKPQIPESVPAPVVASVPEPVKVEKHLFKPAERPTKNTIGQTVVTSLSSAGGATAFSGDDEEKALLEQAIATMPNCHKKPYPVAPDSSMNPLMAVNRLGDLAVESEYSLRVGQSGKKIISATPSATGLVIATQGDLLLGGGSNLGFYWEDVQAIYCDELDTKTGKTYEVYWTATNLNQPIVVQCHTANNMNHLVSALEYFIKSAQGKYVPVTGMPYLNQGMVLGDENKITALWDGSPADNAALQIGDHIWSVSGSPQTPAALEAALQALPSGKQTIEVVVPADWQAAMAKESREHNGKLQPKLTQVELLVP